MKNFEYFVLWFKQYASFVKLEIICHYPARKNFSWFTHACVYMYMILKLVWGKAVNIIQRSKIRFSKFVIFIM